MFTCFCDSHAKMNSCLHEHLDVLKENEFSFHFSDIWHVKIVNFGLWTFWTLVIFLRFWAFWTFYTSIRILNPLWNQTLLVNVT